MEGSSWRNSAFSARYRSLSARSSAMADRSSLTCCCSSRIAEAVASGADAVACCEDCCDQLATLPRNNTAKPAFPIQSGKTFPSFTNRPLKKIVEMPTESVSWPRINCASSPDEECYSDGTFFARANGGTCGIPSPPLSELDDAMSGREMRKTVPAAEVFSTMTSPP